MKKLYKVFRVEDDKLEFVHNTSSEAVALSFIDVLLDQPINHKHGYTVVETWTK